MQPTAYRHLPVAMWHCHKAPAWCFVNVPMMDAKSSSAIRAGAFGSRQAGLSLDRLCDHQQPAHVHDVPGKFSETVRQQAHGGGPAGSRPAVPCRVAAPVYRHRRSSKLPQHGAGGRGEVRRQPSRQCGKLNNPKGAAQSAQSTSWVRIISSGAKGTQPARHGEENAVKCCQPSAPRSTPAVAPIPAHDDQNTDKPHDHQRRAPGAVQGSRRNITASR